MLGSEFIRTFEGKGRAAWEAAALELAREGSVVAWPMVNLKLETPDKSHTGVLPVASDVFAVGTKDDLVRLPLTPGAAQSIANLGGYLLPTPKVAYEIWKAAEAQGVQLTPAPQVNRAPLHLMEDYAKHDVVIQKQLAAAAAQGRSAGFGALVTGHKKDVVISNLYKPHHVLIYGWFWPRGMPTPRGSSQPIQARSNVHDDLWVDYSHGIRLVSPVMTVDGVERKTEDVLRDKDLSKLLSDEGPLHVIRYPATNEPQPYRPASREEYQTLNDVYPRPLTTSLADQGLEALAAMAAARRRP